MDTSDVLWHELRKDSGGAKLGISLNYHSLLKHLNFKKVERETVLEAILKSTFLNTVAKSFGYLKNVAIAVILGFSAETDAFFMAMSLAGFFLIFADVFDSVGVPNLVKARVEDGEEEFEKLASFMLTFTTLLVAIVSVLYFIASPLIFKIPVGFDQQKLTVLKKCYYILFVYVIFYFYYHHFGAIHRAARRFTVFYIGELIFSFSTFILVLTGLLIFKTIWILPAAVSAAQVLSTSFVALKLGHFSLKFFIDNRTKHILKQFLQLCILYGVSRLYVIVDRSFASILPTKSITALAYGYIVAYIPKGLMRFENILITPLSEATNLKQKLIFYATRILGLSIPIACLVYLLSPLIVKLLFGYGAFSHVDWQLTVTASRFYALSLPFAFLWPILYRVHQIRDEMGILTLLALLSVATNACLNYLFIVKFSLGLKGICIATGISLSLVSIFSFTYLMRRL